MRERKIPKPGGSGKVRKLGIPTIADRVVQTALKLVLEPIFEADSKPVSYGFRPLRRAHDAIAEIHFYGTHGYRWVLDADIEACFDSINHTALMDRVRVRAKDKRVLRLVKAFLKTGILTEDNNREDTLTGTPQGGILSPLLANIALSALDEHLTGPWEPGGETGTPGSASGTEKRTGGNTGTALRADSTGPPDSRSAVSACTGSPPPERAGMSPPTSAWPPPRSSSPPGPPPPPTGRAWSTPPSTR
ncbi:reverse transcriptase domain-containing protein [Streptomyces sp. NPDC058770]|uniref:reverse transcriptase domain-containing protein n=1 Tax=unclassified Streptomyces TaxID=2593676 RepID=UPI0036C0FC12